MAIKTSGGKDGENKPVERAYAALRPGWKLGGRVGNAHGGPALSLHAQPMRRATRGN